MSEMFRTVLVPLDGSDRAERALPIAARVARASSARILLVRAAIVPATYGVTYEGQALHWRLVHEEAEGAQAYLGKIAQSSSLAGLPIESVVKVGPAASVILAAAEEHGADLVLMTSRGRTGLGRWVLGSVAEHVAHHAPIPVLLLRGQDDRLASAESNDVDHELRVLVPLDGSPLAETALAPAQALALTLAGAGRVAMHLLLVVAPYAAMPENMPDALLMEGAQAYLELVARRLQTEDTARRVTVTQSVVAQGDVAHAIRAVAESGHEADEVPAIGRYDLVAMATHGQGAVARWALGSVTERVLHGTKLPMLIARPSPEPA
jgi:nucleotide-binding universal stress UspA family protein